MANFDQEGSGKLGQRSGPEEKLVQKKRYEPPSFRCEKVFEMHALSCGKIGPTSAACNANSKIS